MHFKILKKIGFVLLIIFAIIGLGFVSVYFAIKWGFTNTKGGIDLQREAFLQSGQNQTANVLDSISKKKYWQQTEEWGVLKTALIKDKAVLYRVEAVTGIPARLIASQLIVEQLRMFNSDRESYKKFFAPLKILGSQTQFSWGVMGIKRETAILIEKNIKDTSSPYYLGSQYEHLLDFHTGDIENERFIRMTDQHNHYGSYLYAGLYLRQFIEQWQKAGFDISKRVDILATLYNIGFSGSKPNAYPKSGGALITIGERTYSFGSLAQEFYDSNELLDEFPR
ncbi:MAG: hypothetical protein ACYCZW_02150 [Minisyncoccota bacterium]